MSKDNTASLADRLLADWVRQREEAAGHPPETPQADAQARERGGDLAQRIVTRARALPDAPAMQADIGRVLTAGKVVTVTVLLLSLLSGALAAAAALGVTQPASLPLVLLVMVGANLLSLLLWLLWQLVSPRAVRGLAAGLQRIWQWLATRGIAVRGDAGGAGASSVVTTLTAAGTGRWLLASLVHAAWLLFSLSGLLALAVLLSVRGYEWSWATTLLGDASLQSWARWLSVGPAALGVPVDQLPLHDMDTAQARQSWSWWLLAAVFSYGVLPRALALMVCAVLLRRRLHALGRDLQRPGYARLRARLWPEHRAVGIVDPAPPLAASAAPVVEVPRSHWPRGRVHGVSLDGAAADAPPVAGIDWIWLGDVQDTTARAAQLQRLQSERVENLLVLVRAAMSPDRGVERHLLALAQAARAPVHLVLHDYPQLRARGADEAAQRLADWRALAARAGAQVLVEGEQA